MLKHDLIQHLDDVTKWSIVCWTLKHANMSKICQFGKYPIIIQHWIGGEGLKNVVSLRDNWSFYVKKRCMSLILMRAKIFYRPRGFWHNFNIKFMFCENSWIFFWNMTFNEKYENGIKKLRTCARNAIFSDRQFLLHWPSSLVCIKWHVSGAQRL